MSNYALYSSRDSGVSVVGNDGGLARKGMFLSVPKIIVAVVVFVACVVGVGLIVHLTAPKCEKVTPPPQPQTTGATTLPPTMQPQTTGATTPPPVDTDFRLPTNVKPLHYNLVLAPFLYGKGETYFTGKVSILMKADEPTNTFKLHRHASLNVTSWKIMDGGTEVPFTASFDPVKEWYVITLSEGKMMEAGKNYTFEIDKFRAPLIIDLKGLYLSQYQSGSTTKSIATSQLQPTDARKTFPCFDEPTFKATFDVSIVRKSDYVAISNMDTKSTAPAYPKDWFDHGDESASSWIMESYDTTPKMSSYLLAFIVSEFDYINGTDSRGRLYRNWMRPEFKSIGEYALDAAINITEYFENYYQVPYPLTKTDQAAVPDFNAGAMENWGLIIYRETRLLFDVTKDTSSIKQAIGNVISHELAHMWFGNLVTADWWDDIWLNEGFASFTQGLGVDQLHEDWEIDAQFVTGQMASAFDVDSKGSSRPIYNSKVYSPSDIGAMFDTITYRKGASVLRQMYYFLGDKTFKEGIGKYLNGSAYSNAKHEQLFKIMTDQAKANGLSVDVAEVMRRWILQMGFPVVNCQVSGNKLHLAQEHFLSDKSQVPNPQYESPYNYTWYIPITMATDATVNEWTRANVNQKISKEVQFMMNKTQQFDLPGSGSQKWYIVNLWSAGFYRVNYDSANWRALADQLMSDHTVFSPQDRAKIIADSFALAGADKISYDIPLNLTRYLSKEQHYVPWQAAISEFAYIYRMLHRSRPEYGPFSAYMRSLLGPVFANINMTQASDNHLENLKRGLIVRAACLYGVRDCVTQAREIFGDFEGSDYTNLISPDVRSRVLCEGVATSFSVQWDKLFDYMRRETHPGIQNDVLRSLGCSSEPWVLNRFLEYGLDESKVRLQDASTVFSSVAANQNGLQIVWDYLQANWKAIADALPGSFTTSYFVQNLGAYNTRAKKAELLAFREANREQLGSASRAMDLAIDSVEANIQWMDANLEELSNWLATS